MRQKFLLLYLLCLLLRLSQNKYRLILTKTFSSQLTSQPRSCLINTICSNGRL